MAIENKCWDLILHTLSFQCVEVGHNGTEVDEELEAHEEHMRIFVNNYAPPPSPVPSLLDDDIVVNPWQNKNPHTCLQAILSDLYFLAKGKCKNWLKHKGFKCRDLCHSKEQESELKKCKINNNIIQWCSNKKHITNRACELRAMPTTET